MSVLRLARTASRLQQHDPAWVLLRARNADITIAILDRHLAQDERKLPAPVLFERVEADLDDLRSDGYDLPRTAQAYCSEWREQQVLVRRSSDDAREETYELSPGALTAIRFVSQVADPSATVTESRLATIQGRLRLLAEQTDRDLASRLSSLREQRDRIDAEIARASSGNIDVLPNHKAAEQLEDILALTAEVPADFARVRQAFESLNRSLRESLIDDDGPRANVLEDLFRGVDQLADSEAGRTFTGFYALLLDPEQGHAFEESLSNVLQRDFMASVDPAKARSLRQLLPTLRSRGSEIHGVLTSFSRSLRRFVQSHALEQERQLNRQLRGAMADALRAAESVKAHHRTALELELTSISMTSLSTLRLHNPGDFATEAVVATEVPEAVAVEDLLELARATDIDFGELESNINATLVACGPCTIAGVVEHCPATQGVASVVGLLVLAQRHAEPLDGRESVHWDERTGTVNRFLFTERIPA